MPSPKDPNVRKARAKLAVAVRDGRNPDEARRILAGYNIESYIRQTLKGSKPLSDEQIGRIVGLLHRPSGGDAK